MSPVAMIDAARQALKAFLRDEAFMLAAALAFYTALSLAQLLVVLLWIAGLLGRDAQQRLIDEVIALVGPEGGEAVRMIVESAGDTPGTGTVAGLVSIAALLFGATGAFVQLQRTLNRVWNVRRKRGGALAMVKKRLLSLGLVVTLGFLLLVSMGVSAAVSAAIGPLERAVPGTGWLWQTSLFLAPLVVIVPLFALVYRLLPDVVIRWREVWLGAVITGLLFSVGKTAIGLYLGNSSVGSAYGAAGSFMVLLVWVYYSALIVFYGAEVTQVWARRRGAEIVPAPHAEWTSVPRP